MIRVPAGLTTLACAAAAFAATATAVVARSAATAAQGAAVHGTITYLDGSLLTVQTGGRRLGVANAMTATANAITHQVWPYVYGGGHAQAGAASIGLRGPGYNGRRRGYDCSGSVAAVLAGAGFWQPGSGVPDDYGIIQQLRSEHLIARGAGQGPDEVTLYDDPNVHIFMNIDGRFFGTSDGGGGNAKGGPTWLNDGAPDATTATYHRWHFLPAALRNRTTYGHSFTFTAGYNLVFGAQTGDKVRISYTERRSGTMVATAIEYVGARTTTGTVTAIDPSTVTIQTAAAASLTFATSIVPGLVDGLQVGDSVSFIYTRHAGQLIPHAVKVLSTAGAGQPTGARPPTGPGLPPGGPPSYPTSQTAIGANLS